MLNINPRTDARSAKAYYARRDSVEPDPAVWFGKGAERLGLEGEATQQARNRLFDNKAPDGSKLTPRGGENRLAGWDANFHPPKSVSLAIEFAPNGEQVKAALVRSILKTVEEKIEPLAATRIRKDGKYEDLVTGEVIGSLHMHPDARPVNSKVGLHWHGHAVLYNGTFNAEENRHKALKVHEVMKQAPDIQNHFHKTLRSELHAIGFQTKGKGTAWEIMGVSKATVRKFSERNGVIREALDTLKEAGKLTKGKRKTVGLETREEKVPGTLEDWRKEWVSRLTDREVKTFDRLQARPKFGRVGHRNHLHLIGRLASYGQTHSRDDGIERAA